MVIQVNLSGGKRPPSWMMFAPGALLILLGFSILVFEDLLRVIVGCTFLFFGMALVAVPMRARGIGPFRD
ncbi:MAG: hypothetical protein KDB80_06120 [Planctomycetes bacterium]|nr:hypothetical protein [Planctomycetota bacterium]